MTWDIVYLPMGSVFLVSMDWLRLTSHEFLNKYLLLSSVYCYRHEVTVYLCVMGYCITACNGLLYTYVMG